MLASLPARGSDESQEARPFVVGEPTTRYRLAWHDEFDGTSLNTQEWDPRTDSKHWSTQRLENLAVSGGLLRLVLKKESEPVAGKHYTGAGAISRRTFTHGFYETRFRCPPGKGWHTSFWMQRHDGSGGTDPRAASQEIDVIENDSVNLTRYGVNLHLWNPPPHRAMGHKDVITPNLSADFHTFGCAFDARRIIYYFDGRPVQQVDARGFAHGPMNIWLTSIASSLGRTDQVDDTVLPAEAVFDYVRFFEPVGEDEPAPTANPETQGKDDRRARARR